jgi:hypothetical protein
MGPQNFEDICSSSSSSSRVVVVVVVVELSDPATRMQMLEEAGVWLLEPRPDDFRFPFVFFLVVVAATEKLACPLRTFLRLLIKLVGTP